MDNIEKIGKKFYKEVGEEELTKKLENLLAQKASINYDSLKEEYDNNVAAMKDYEKSINVQIKQIKKVLENDAPIKPSR